MNLKDQITESEKPVQTEFKNKFLLKGISTGYNKFYMYALTIVLALTGYFLYPSLLLIPLFVRAKEVGVDTAEIKANANVLFNADRLMIDRNIMLLIVFSIFVVTLILFLIGLYKIHKKNLLSVLTGFPRFRKRKFWFGFLLWASLLIFTLMIQYFLDTENFTLAFDLPKFLGSLAILLVFIPIQTLWEEILFRGYTLQGLSIGLKQGLFPVLITSLIFSLMHMSNPEVKEYGIFSMFFYYFTFGLFLGIITLMDEGLELAFGIHCANNLIVTIFTTSKVSVLKAYSIFAIEYNNGMAEMMLSLCMLVVTFSIFWIKYKWKNFDLLYR